MFDRKEIFGKYRDDTGGEYYCPINAVADSHIVSEWELENCVDAATAERYSGNIILKDRKLG